MFNTYVANCQRVRALDHINGTGKHAFPEDNGLVIYRREIASRQRKGHVSKVTGVQASNIGMGYLKGCALSVYFKRGLI